MYLQEQWGLFSFHKRSSSIYDLPLIIITQSLLHRRSITTAKTTWDICKQDFFVYLSFMTTSNLVLSKIIIKLYRSFASKMENFFSAWKKYLTSKKVNESKKSFSHFITLYVSTQSTSCVTHKLWPFRSYHV